MTTLKLRRCSTVGIIASCTVYMQHVALATSASCVLRPASGTLASDVMSRQQTAAPRSLSTGPYAYLQMHTDTIIKSQHGRVTEFSGRPHWAQPLTSGGATIEIELAS
eukprot:5187590-Pleurochrysis_carterae.AAC.3